MGCCTKSKAVRVKTAGVLPKPVPSAAVVASSHAKKPPPPHSVSSASSSVETCPLMIPHGDGDRTSSSLKARSPGSSAQSSRTASAVCATSPSWTESAADDIGLPIISETVKTAECDCIILASDFESAVCWDEDLALGKMVNAEDHSTKASSEDPGEYADSSRFQHFPRGMSDEVVVSDEEEVVVSDRRNRVVVLDRQVVSEDELLSGEVVYSGGDRCSDDMLSCSVSESSSALSPLPKISGTQHLGTGGKVSGEQHAANSSSGDNWNSEAEVRSEVLKRSWWSLCFRSCC